MRRMAERDPPDAMPADGARVPPVHPRAAVWVSARTHGQRNEWRGAGVRRLQAARLPVAADPDDARRLRDVQTPVGIDGGEVPAAAAGKDVVGRGQERESEVDPA